MRRSKSGLGPLGSKKRKRKRGKGEKEKRIMRREKRIMRRERRIMAWIWKGFCVSVT